MKKNYGLLVLLLLGSLSIGCKAAEKMKKAEDAVQTEMNRAGSNFKSTMEVFNKVTNPLVRSAKPQEYSDIFNKIIVRFSKTDSATAQKKLSEIEKTMAQMQSQGASKKEMLKAFETSATPLLRSAAPNAYLRVYGIAVGLEAKETKGQEAAASAEQKGQKTVEGYFNEFWTLVETQYSENGDKKDFHDLAKQLDKPETKQKIEAAFRTAKPEDAAKVTAAVRDGVALMFGGEKTDKSKVPHKDGNYTVGKESINKQLPASVPLFKTIEDAMGVSAAAA